MTAGRYVTTLVATVFVVSGNAQESSDLVGIGSVLLGFLVGWDLVGFCTWAYSNLTGGEK